MKHCVDSTYEVVDNSQSSRPKKSIRIDPYYNENVVDSTDICKLFERASAEQGHSPAVSEDIQAASEILERTLP